MSLPPAQQLSGFPGALFPQNQGGPCFPVSYANQGMCHFFKIGFKYELNFFKLITVFKPLIPGYAPAPGNERRSNVLGGDSDNEFASRFFVDQPISQMQNHKQRKH